MNPSAQTTFSTQHLLLTATRIYFHVQASKAVGILEQLPFPKLYVDFTLLFYDCIIFPSSSALLLKISYSYTQYYCMWVCCVDFLNHSNLYSCLSLKWFCFSLYGVWGGKTITSLLYIRRQESCRLSRPLIFIHLIMFVSIEYISSDRWSVGIRRCRGMGKENP